MSDEDYWPSNLPPSAIRELKAAAATPTDQDPLARIKAIERATQNIRRKYPQFFRTGGDDGTARGGH